MNILQPRGKIRIPRSKVVTSRRDSKTSREKRRKNRANVVRGTEVTIRESSAERQVIYGKMKCGGVTTFVETNSNSSATLQVGSGNSQVVFTARTGGVGGNSITVTITLSGTYPTLDCTVAGNDISIRLKSTSGVSESTAAQVITKVRGTAAADALVAVSKGDGDSTGLMAAMSQTALSGGGGTWLHQMITLATHEINSVDKLYLDDREVAFGGTPDARWGSGIWANKVFMAVQPGTDSQEAQPDLLAQLPTKWTSTDKQSGCAGAYLILVWNQNVYAEGLPEINFLVRGAKVYDPRTATTVYSTNAALIVANFLTNARYGIGVPYADLDETALIAAANICDESVSLAGGGSESRYTINGVFDTGESKDDILQQLLSAMDGEIVEDNGKLVILAGAYRAPSITLTEDDIVGEVLVQTHLSRSDTFNCIRGTYVDPNSNYHETDIPVVKNSTYITEDGGEIYEDVALNFVTQSCQAQRLLKIQLERVRQGLSVSFDAKLTALNLRAGDTVMVSFTEYGWSSKIFEVRRVDTVIQGDGSTNLSLSLRETASAIHDWNSGLETTVDLAPDTTLPSAFDVDEVTNLILTSGTSELYRRSDGTILTRLKASWDTATGEFVVNGGTFELQYKQSSAVNWSQSFTVPGYVNFMHFLDLQDGVQYDVRIRALNTIGYASDWTTVTAHTVLGKTQPPSDVTGFAHVVTDDGISLSWNQIADTDRDQFEIRLGTVWSSGTLIARVKGSGTSYLYPYRTAGSVSLMIKAIDTSGNYSTTESSLSVTLAGPNPIQSFVVKTINNNVLLDWDDPLASTFSVKEYDVYKGVTFGTAAKIGTVFGSFHTYLEEVGGDFTYWVVAVDAGGNRSTEVSASTTVAASNDFFVLESVDPLPDFIEYENAVIGGSPHAPSEDPGSVWLPFPTFVTGGILTMTRESGPTWSDWFSSQGWTSFQDAINAGFENYLSPGLVGLGHFVLKVDLGTSFASGFIKWTWSEETLGDSGAVLVPTVSVSNDDVSYTDHVGAAQVFATTFRYVKLRMDFSSIDEHTLSRLYDNLLTIQLERDEETGVASVLSADAGTGGTVVTFTKAWADVEDIQLTAEGTTARTAVLNFSDVPNPTTFKILVFNDSGSAINSSVRYRVRGALAGA